MQFYNDMFSNMVVALDRNPTSDRYNLHVIKHAPETFATLNLELDDEGQFQWVEYPEFADLPPLLGLPGFVARKLVDVIQAGDNDGSKVMKAVGEALSDAIYGWARLGKQRAIVPDFADRLQAEWVKGWEKGYESGYVNGHHRGWEDGWEAHENWHG